MKLRTTAFAVAAAIGSTLLAGTAFAADTPKTDVRIVAHRGGGTGSSESSPDALYKTYKAGVKYVELDVWFNFEGKQFVLHDSTLDRTTKCTGKAVDKTEKKLESCGVMSLDKALYLTKKYGFTTYLHLKNTRYNREAQLLTKKVADRDLTSKIRYLADDASTLALMDRYASNSRLALMVNKQSEWSVKNYPELWYYRGPISRKDVAAAQKRGQRVSIVQYSGAVAKLSSALQLNPDGWITSTVDKDLDYLADLLEPAEPAEPTEPAKS